MKQNISVLMSVYKNEKPEYFRAAVNSVLNQTVLPEEIVLVRDGEVPDALQTEIDKLLSECSIRIKYLPLPENGGLGKALNLGVRAASNELIARMDTDDISVPQRFEKQLEEFNLKPNVDVMGGQVLEFEGDTSMPTGKRTVPTSNEEIALFLKKRNAFNHPTVMFKKSSVINAGNYSDRHYVEDYDLWLRMLKNGSRFENLPETLVYMRVNGDTYSRRGGVEYFRSLKKLEKDKLVMSIISLPQYLGNVIVRYVQCVLLRGRMRKLIYRRILRK